MRHNRGIPTDEVRREMRGDPPIYYLVGTPEGRLSKLEAKLLEQPWNSVRPGVEVKLLAQEGESSILAQRRQRIDKERAIRRWIVERTFAWLGNYRRLARDYETSPCTSETLNRCAGSTFVA
jgi:hypothetical protein